MRALIVEDDLCQAQLISSALERDGFETVLAQSLPMAMRRALTGGYDIAILDLFLADGNTSSLMDLLRMRHPSMPIISVTGSNLFSSGDLQHNLSADYLFHKPVRPEHLSSMALYLTGQLTQDAAMAS